MGQEHSILKAKSGIKGKSHRDLYKCTECSNIVLFDCTEYYEQSAKSPYSLSRFSRSESLSEFCSTCSKDTIFSPTSCTPEYKQYLSGSGQLKPIIISPHKISVCYFCGLVKRPLSDGRLSGRCSSCAITTQQVFISNKYLSLLQEKGRITNGFLDKRYLTKSKDISPLSCSHCGLKQLYRSSTLSYMGGVVDFCSTCKRDTLFSNLPRHLPLHGESTGAPLGDSTESSAVPSSATHPQCIPHHHLHPVCGPSPIAIAAPWDPSIPSTRYTQEERDAAIVPQQLISNKAICRRCNHASQVKNYAHPIKVDIESNEQLILTQSYKYLSCQYCSSHCTNRVYFCPNCKKDSHFRFITQKMWRHITKSTNPEKSPNEGASIPISGITSHTVQSIHHPTSIPSSQIGYPADLANAHHHPVSSSHIHKVPPTYRSSDPSKVDW